jgi:peptide chain release factor 2
MRYHVEMKKLDDLAREFEQSFAQLEVEQKLAESKNLEKLAATPDFWSDNKEAQKISKQLAKLQSEVEPWVEIKKQLDDLAELAKDKQLASDIESEIAAAETKYLELKKTLRFDSKFDDHGAILRISAGAGGADAMDFAQMLERMYLRWGDKNEMKVRELERTTGEVAGVKTVVLEVEGTYAYGKLRSENGVHRLVRLSPFNAESRETSFALVEVLPQIDAPGEVQIDGQDLKIDVFRAGGHGGQSVNTTDSAVRVTHLPT